MPHRTPQADREEMIFWGIFSVSRFRTKERNKGVGEYKIWGGSMVESKRDWKGEEEQGRERLG